jgi:hypothetical protein
MFPLSTIEQRSHLARLHLGMHGTGGAASEDSQEEG